MKKAQEYIDILREHADIYTCKEYGMTALALFGSVARGGHNDNSDVDVFCFYADNVLSGVCY
ncbi:MAG TPA: hypothetical protein DEO38_02230 [Bacteroidales bacterium]|nr:hypothetical protein [Bacteroidales bacterium]